MAPAAGYLLVQASGLVNKQFNSKAELKACWQKEKNDEVAESKRANEKRTRVRAETASARKVAPQSWAALVTVRTAVKREKGSYDIADRAVFCVLPLLQAKKPSGGQVSGGGLQSGGGRT
eukprot:gene15211-11456_t